MSLSPWELLSSLVFVIVPKRTHDFATAKVIRHARAARLDGALATQIIFKQMTRCSYRGVISAKARKG